MAATNLCMGMAPRLQGVSVPYSSGQWLQPWILAMSHHCILGFSPLFIGSMAATRNGHGKRGNQVTFQSPIHRVNGCNLQHQQNLHADVLCFSPLFIGSMAATEVDEVSWAEGKGFSPLFIGSMAATEVDEVSWAEGKGFSPLFIGSMAATSVG